MSDAGLPHSLQQSLDNTKVSYAQLGKSGLRVSIPILRSTSQGRLPTGEATREISPLPLPETTRWRRRPEDQKRRFPIVRWICRVVNILHHIIMVPSKFLSCRYQNQSREIRFPHATQRVATSNEGNHFGVKYSLRKDSVQVARSWCGSGAPGEPAVKLSTRPERKDGGNAF